MNLQNINVLQLLPFIILILIVLPYQKFGLDKKKASILKWLFLSGYAAILFYQYYFK